MKSAGSDEIPSFGLRDADESDYRFAKALYLEMMQPLLIKLGTWDERRVPARFRRSFRPERARIITLDGVDVGWLQVSEDRTHITLNQIHIVEEFRSRGIGGRLIRDLLAEAHRKQKPVVLSVVRNNPALALYQRLGFRVIKEDREKLYMRWDGGSPALEQASGPAPLASRPEPDEIAPV